MGIRACEQKMRESKAKLGMGRGKKRGKGEDVAGSRAVPRGRMMG
jgi:hypothetical protein